MKWKKYSLLYKIVQLCNMMQYIPQGPPFQMVDRIIETNDVFTICSLNISKQQLFVNEHGHFLEAGIIEHMAQTAAAGSGFRAAQEDKPAPVGFIGSVKNFKLCELPKVHQIIQTKITVLHTMGNVQVVEAISTVNEQIVASAEFKIFLQD